MALTRKPGFCRDWDLLPVRAFPPVTINGYPESHYRFLRLASGGWIGISFEDRDRIVRVEHAPQMTITDFGGLVGIRHLNIARFLGLYFNRNSTDIVYEHTDLDLLDICPLASEAEVASVIAQVLSAIMYLRSLAVDVRISSIRVSMFGLVKLILDFHHRPTTDIIYRKNMYRFMVSYVEQMMKVSSPRAHVWTYDAAEFLDILYARELPPSSHPFLSKSRGPAALRGPAQVVMRTLMATRLNDKDS
ncbi:hypothetical protein BKA67DRAFT_664720 [Truncatella angustata]|uniref:Uncharacterized protein n=1 Tax=Truncatella angustata TaxID=152316 RepID=A0A9P8RH23_9PEZI|nr:uncharacterized protein BKA67DRAFT_664720 [Truncatella angustata]KAH6645702.1 hypothetical protein BKA67DRAFT_664720 [Truncatella angustata]KAH8194331.1 hypothetical protein TruAng_011507 [Truncatella angustata]